MDQPFAGTRPRAIRPSPDASATIAGSDHVRSGGRQLAARAFVILRECSGASPEALHLIGEAMRDVAATWRRLGAAGAADELAPGTYDIWREDDATFELTLQVLGTKSDLGPALGYDTWTVVSPLAGSVRVHWVKAGNFRARDLKPGESAAFEAGTAVKPKALGAGGAAMLILFGISRSLLSPPVRHPLPTGGKKGAAL